MVIGICMHDSRLGVPTLVMFYTIDASLTKSSYNIGVLDHENVNTNVYLFIQRVNSINSNF